MEFLSAADAYVRYIVHLTVFSMLIGPASSQNFVVLDVLDASEDVYGLNKLFNSPVSQTGVPDVGFDVHVDEITRTVMPKVMPKVMQNVVVLMEPSEEADETPLKAGNMFFNRFCIDENAAFELSGVNYLEKSSEDMENGKTLKFKVQRKIKGKEYSFLRSYFISRN